MKGKSQDLLVLLLRLFPLPQSRTYTPRDLQAKCRGSDVCRGRNSLWTRTLDRYTRAGFPECVVSTMSGPVPKTTQDRAQTKDTHPIPGQIKIPDPAGNRTRPAGLEGRDSTDHATATDKITRSLITNYYYNNKC